MQHNQKDQFLECIKVLCQKNQQVFSEKTLLAGATLIDNKLSPKMFMSIVRKIGYEAKIKKIALKKLSDEDMPFVFFLKDGSVCLCFTRVSQGMISIVNMRDSDKEVSVNVQEISSLAEDFIIVLEYIAGFDWRSTQFEHVQKVSWFWDTVKHFKYIYMRVVLGATLVNVFSLASSFFSMNIYNRVIPNNAVATLWGLAIGLFVLYIFDFLIRTLRIVLVDSACKKADIMMSAKIFEHVMHIELQYKPISAGAFANKMHEFESIVEFFSSAIFLGMVDLPFILLFLFVIYTISSELVVIALVMVPITLLINFFLKTPMQFAVSKAMLSKTQKQALLVESVANLEAIKQLSIADVIKQRWNSYVNVAAHYGVQSRQFSAIASNATLFMQNVAYVVMIIWGVYLINEQKLTTGGLIACSILISRTLAPIAQVTNLLTRLAQTQSALKNLNEIMKLPKEEDKDSDFLHRDKLAGDIKFKDVIFAYPHQKKPSLNRVSLHIPAGQKVGIIGKIGAGKTTILKLILKLYQPQSGIIYFDDIDAQQVSPADIRRNIGLVEQDTRLFFGTIRNNIAIVKPTASDEEIVLAAKNSGAHNFIDNNPYGYDLMIGEQGEGLSGGQRQTLSIARILLLDPPILMFDEPTSFMDRIAEAEFVNTIKNILTNKTVIMVTHSLPLLEILDRLIVIDNGVIILDGPRMDVLSALKNQLNK